MHWLPGYLTHLFQRLILDLNKGHLGLPAGIPMFVFSDRDGHLSLPQNKQFNVFNQLPRQSTTHSGCREDCLNWLDLYSGIFSAIGEK